MANQNLQGKQKMCVTREAPCPAPFTPQKSAAPVTPLIIESGTRRADATTSDVGAQVEPKPRDGSSRSIISMRTDSDHSTDCWPSLDAVNDADFAPFTAGITQEAVDAAYGLLAPSGRVGQFDQLRIVLKNNVLHVHQRNDSELAKGRPHPVVLQLLKLLCSSPGGLPDADLVFNAGDYGLADRDAAHGQPPPVWSFAKQNAQHADLYYPYWSALWLEQTRSPAAAATPWEEKAPRLIWRGSQTGNPPTPSQPSHREAPTWRSGRWRLTPRAQLVLRCANLSHICDAGFHRWAPYVSDGVRRDMERATGGLRPRLDWAETQRHRYVGLIEGEGGTSASRSLREFGESGTATFMTESPAAEFWHGLLRPFVHYVPLSPGLEDLKGKLAWARANDGAMRHIARAAARLKSEALTDARILCYMRSRWRRYASLLRFEPSVRRASACPPPSPTGGGGACRVPFRRLKVLPSVAQKLSAYVKRHNLASSPWCLATLQNHSRHPETLRW